MEQSSSGRTTAAGLWFALVAGLVIAPASQAPAVPGIYSPDMVARRLLNDTVGAVINYWEGPNPTFAGFDAAFAATVSPEITWADGDAVGVDVVNIGYINGKGTRLMVETLSRSGTSFCLGYKDLPKPWVDGGDPAGGAFGTYRGCKNAPSLYQPDAMIKFVPGGLIGEDIYSPLAAHERVSVHHTCTSSGCTRVTFLIRVQNDGTAADSFAVKGCSSTSDVSIRFFSDGGDITELVTSGAFGYRHLKPGDYAEFLMKMHPLTAHSVAARCLVSATSKNAPGLSDAVLGRVSVVRHLRAQ